MVVGVAGRLTVVAMKGISSNDARKWRDVAASRQSHMRVKYIGG